MAKLFKRREPQQPPLPEPEPEPSDSYLAGDEELQDDGDAPPEGTPVHSLMPAGQPAAARLRPGSLAARFMKRAPGETEDSDDVGRSPASAPLEEETGGLRMMELEDSLAPEMPKQLDDTGIDPDVLAGLLLKYGASVSAFTSQSAAHRVCLPGGMVSELLEALRKEKMLEVLGETRGIYRYAVTDRGRERAMQVAEVSRYVGPAPVSIETYKEALEKQLKRLPPVNPEAVRKSVSSLVLPEEIVEIAGLASSSGRSLFVWGPPGTGKTTIGHLLHESLGGSLWIPYCIGIEDNIIRLFDPQCHTRIDNDTADERRRVDSRWVRIRRPFVVAGGELTIDALDLAYTASGRFYEAPLHMKANGGIFLLDDLGYQRAQPRQLLSRWIFPLERGTDFLAMRTGQKFAIPFSLMLIISTNLQPDTVIEPAFMRRMGYRLHLDLPMPDEYARIFERYAEYAGVHLVPGTVERLIGRYHSEDRPMRSSEPRDLIERSRDLCRFRGVPFELTEEVLDVAWKGYFGETPI
jgi:hypothetical protein